MEHLVNLEDVKWRQRSRALWMREVDRNTAYFHARASSRRKKTIEGLHNDLVNWASSLAGLHSLVLSFFNDLFRSGTPNMEQLDTVFPHDLRVVSEGMNLELVKPYTALEVQDALFAMDTLKAPGPDGLPPSFFQRNWHIMGAKVTLLILNFLNDRIPCAAFSDTDVVLIPKCDHPLSLKQFRPISLCNVVYHIAAKCISIRLRPLMDSIIYPFQSAFIPGRLITDNILIAFEINHFLYAPGADGGLSIKLDMAKAFDRVEWPFLFEALGHLGFAAGFISLIKMCISSSLLSFLINGERVGVVRSGRGLRQGNPLFPYLFIMCSEFLSRMLARAELNGRISGIAVAPSAPKISHLLFADDTLIFCGANRSEVEAVSHILGTFAAASRLIINFSKSSVMISRSVYNGVASDIVNAFGIPRCDSHELYLGVPCGGSGLQALALLVQYILCPKDYCSGVSYFCGIWIECADLDGSLASTALLFSGGGALAGGADP
ncbi:hypothetical protein KSP39_PZI000633 [Platanthera zijinensis]|uniref:Reverse transcriptase domain-containing protein n=1 Tax=Platanthera zijinensis TaxID=2320716 RepID=A0AAP0C4Z6_9ASPA